jgi:hypothetical protein
MLRFWCSFSRISLKWVSGSQLNHIQAKTWDVFWLAAGYQEHGVTNFKCIIDIHIILVRVIHSIQNSCIKYSTQSQHFAEMFTYSDNANYNLNFYYFIVSIYLWFHLLGNYSCVSDVSEDPDGISTAPITAPSFDETARICITVAVVDTRSLAGARNHCEGSVPHHIHQKGKFRWSSHSTEVILGSCSMRHNIIGKPNHIDLNYMGSGKLRPGQTTVMVILQPVKIQHRTIINSYWYTFYFTESCINSSLTDRDNLWCQIFLWNKLS